jgi:hypothetical protein
MIGSQKQASCNYAIYSTSLDPRSTFSKPSFGLDKSASFFPTFEHCKAGQWKVRCGRWRSYIDMSCHVFDADLDCICVEIMLLQLFHVLMWIETNWCYNNFEIDKNMRLVLCLFQTFGVVVVKMVVWIVFCSILCMTGMMKTALKY